MASVTTIDETDPRFVRFTANGELGGDALCGSSFTIASAIRSWKERAKSHPANVMYGTFDDSSTASTLAFSFYINEPNCMKQATGLTDQPSRTAALGIGNDKGAKEYLTVAHELGHVLGMDHPFGDCGNNLMCESGGDSSPHIPGCQIRNGQTQSPAPYNCVPAEGEVVPGVANCALARKGAGASSQTVQQPVPLEPAVDGAIGWASSNAPLSYDPDHHTEGTAALRVDRGGWSSLSSPTFRTADWLTVGSRLAVDVFLDPNQPNPNWVGSLDFSIEIPAAGIPGSYLGHIELTGKTLGEWATVEVDVPANIRDALLGDYPGGVLKIAVNFPENAPAVLLDNLRAAGDIQPRTVPHTGPIAGGLTSALFSFEDAADWSSDANNTRLEAGLVTQGNSALAIDAEGYTTVVSREFNGQSDVGTATSHLTIDVFVPDPQPNPYWVGALQMYLSCPSRSLNHQYLGQVELTPLFVDDFNTLNFQLPPEIVAALNDQTALCSLELALNVNAEAGEFVLDNLAFR